MGHPTDFIGHINITPALNDDEVAYLVAFARSRRFRRPDGPYDVPVDPLAERHADGDSDLYGVTAEGQPGLWCDWEPCRDGCCLATNGGERSVDPVRWLRYLIAHFLAPDAAASRSEDERFAGFGFDHVLEGMVVGCRRADRELFAIVVAHNRVRRRVLRPPDQRYVGRPPLPYELALDRDAGSRRRVRSERDGLAPVVPLQRKGARPSRF